MKRWVYVTNLDNHSETHWDATKTKWHISIVLVLNIIQKNWKLISYGKVIANTYGINRHVSIMCGYFCTGFIDFMLNQKILEYFQST